MKKMSKEKIDELMKNMSKEEFDELMKDDPWESRELGASAEHARRVSHAEALAVDDALGLQVISIRLQKKLIENLKKLAKHEGIGYQPLIRQVLTHYVRDQLQGKKRHARRGK